MQTRQLGYTDLHLTTIGLGTWALGGEWFKGWGPQDDAESIGAIQRALELGINWIDTAAIYGLGHSEEVVGRALRGRRSEVIVATKCCRFLDTATQKLYNNFTAPSVRAECEASLRRLGIETIDLYQIHWAPEGSEEAWAAIADLIRAGKARYGGVSNCSLEQLKKLQAIHPIASLQPSYSMLRREVEAEILPYCAANGIGVIPYGVMQEGLLSGKMTRERIAGLAASDFRRSDPRFAEPQISKTLALVEALRPIAARHERSVAQLAIAWALRRAEITSAIIGARRAEQIEETALAADWRLSEAEIAEIESLLQ